MKLVWAAIVVATISLALPAWAQEAAAEGSVDELTEEAKAEPADAESSDETKKDDEKKEAEAEAQASQEEATETPVPEAAAEEAALEAVINEKRAEKKAVDSTPASAAAVAEVTAEADESEEELPPWAGSSISFGNRSTLRGADTYSAPYLSEDFTNYDPRYSVSMSLNPVYQLTDSITLSGSIGFSGEVTQSNGDPTPWNINDLLINVSFGKLFDLPGEVGVSATTASQLGISEYSIGDGNFFAQSATLTLSRKFDLLKGLNLSFSGTGGYMFRESTMAGTPASVLGTNCTQPTGESNEDFSCESWDPVYSGVQGGFGNLGQRFAASLGLNDMFSVSASYGLGQQLLYATSDFSDREMSTTGGFAAAPSTTRYSQSVSVGLSAAVTGYLNVSLGVSNGGPQLSPDSTFYTPLFNRNINAYLNLTLTPAALLVEATDS